MMANELSESVLKHWVRREAAGQDGVYPDIFKVENSVTGYGNSSKTAQN